MRKENTAEGGIQTELVTVANSGGASGDPFDFVTTAGDGVGVYYENSHGSQDMAFYVTLGGTGEGTRATVGYSIVADIDAIGGRLELYVTAYPAGDPLNFHTRLATVVAGVAEFGLTLNHLGQLVAWLPSGETYTVDTPLPLEQLVRVEFYVATADDSNTFNVMLSLDPTTPGFDDLYGDSFPWPGPKVFLDEVHFGQIGTGETSAIAYWMDNVGVLTYGTLGPYAPADVVIEIPAAVVDVEAGIPGLGVMAAIVPAATVSFEAGIPQFLGIRLVSPDDEATIPVIHPQLLVNVLAPDLDPDTLIVRVTVYDAYHSDSQVITVTPTDVNGLIPTVVDAGELDEGGHYWTAELLNADDEVIASTGERAFIINTVNTHSRIEFTVTVTDDEPPAVIWFARPPVGVIGDSSTVTGQGLGPNQVTAYISDNQATVTGFRHVPAAADAYTDDRRIDPFTGRTDTEHDEVDLIVPAGVTTPGGPLHIQGT